MDWSWAYDGVNQTIPRNAGPECFQYLTWRRQLIECVTVTSLFVFVLHWIGKRLSQYPDPKEEHLLVLQQRYYDSQAVNGRTRGGGQQQSSEGGGGGYFGSTAAQPPSILLASEKSAPQFNNNNNNSNNNDSAEVCRCCAAPTKRNEVCRVHFSVNSSGYCVKSVENSPSDDLQKGSTEWWQLVSGSSDQMVLGKQVLLVLMTFVLGLELGFKFASRTVIYLLNPCHITTIMQVSETNICVCCCLG